MSKKNDYIEPLDPAIQAAQMEQKFQEFDRAMKKEWGPRDKRFFIFLGITVIIGVATIILNNPLVLQIGAPIIGIFGGGLILSDSIKETRKVNKMMEERHNRLNPFNNSSKGEGNQNNNIMKLPIEFQQEETRTPDEILKEGFEPGNPTSYYSDVTKKHIEKIKQDERAQTPPAISVVGKDNNPNKVVPQPPKNKPSKYELALEMQKKRTQIHIVEENEAATNSESIKESTMHQIQSDIATYQILYNLPKLCISNEEWYAFFEHTYKLLCQHGVQDKYMELIKAVNRMALADVLVNNLPGIYLGNYIDNLNVFTICKPISNRDVEELQKKIKKCIPSAEIIKFHK